jgi:transcriptional regulator with XRE-family HTH domain
LRQLRFERRLTIANVSGATGIAKSTLSRVENNQLSLTYAKLVQLCQGLKIDLADLFAHDPSDRTQPTARRAYTAAGGGRTFDVKLQRYTYLCSELAGKKMTPMIGIVRSRTLAESNGLLTHPGEEFTYVLEGRLVLHTEFYEPLTVDVGGSVYFDSEMGHAYVSVGTTPLRILCVCSTPEPVLTESLDRAVQRPRGVVHEPSKAAGRRLRRPR